MGSNSKRRESFSTVVAAMLKRMQPNYDIQETDKKELIINGRRLDLENLERMVNQDPSRCTEIVEHYLEQLFSGDAVHLSDMSLDFARARIMPRIQPESIFQHLNREMVAHMPYVNDTVIVFVVDLPHMTVSITTEQAIRWGVEAEELQELALKNLRGYAPELDVQIVESKEGGRAAIMAENDGYDAARLLLPDLHHRLRDCLGGDFFVATPARDMFLALSCDPHEFVERIHQRVLHDHGRLPYPITPDFFLATRDGVAGTRGELDAGNAA